MVAQLIAGGLLFVVMANLAKGRPPSERAEQRLWRFFNSSVIAGAIAGTALLLFIIPGIITLRAIFTLPI
jgi:hypothetical protein